MKQTPPYTVIYQDEYIAVLNKASGILTAADRWDPEAPRLDLLAAEEFGRLYAVHRIDKDTSGLIIYARTEEAHRTLSMSFENRQIEKTYHALINGRPLWAEQTVDVSLRPDGDMRHRTVEDRRNGKPSVTHFRVMGICGPYCWIEAKPETGRTHQIRAHLAAINLSIICDPLYGGNQKPFRLSDVKRSWRGDTYEERPLLNRLSLHAYKLTFAHPVSEETVSFTAPYQKDMEAVRKQLLKLFGTDPLAGE